VEIKLVNFEGNLITISKEHEDFPAVVVSLGAFGVVYQFTIQLQPIFYIAQAVYKTLPLIQLKENFNQIMSAGYCVNFFTNWVNPRQIDQIWVKKLVLDKEKEIIFEPELFGAQIYTEQVNVYDAGAPDECTVQLGKTGVWYERLVLFNVGLAPLTKSELQSEYFISLEYAYEVLNSISEIHHIISPYLQQTEIRTVAADDLWMSPCYKKSVICFHTTWKYDYDNVIKCIQLMEEKLSPFNPIPHWGKLFTLQPSAIQKCYPKLNEWKQLVEKYDPNGKFRNEFLTSLLWT